MSSTPAVSTSECSRLRESWRLSHAARLLDMTPIVRKDQPPAIQHTVGDEANERRRHDRASGITLVERLHLRHGVTVLLDEALNDVRCDVAGRRLRGGRRLEFARRTRRL